MSEGKFYTCTSFLVVSLLACCRCWSVAVVVGGFLLLSPSPPPPPSSSSLPLVPCCCCCFFCFLLVLCFWFFLLLFWCCFPLLLLFLAALVLHLVLKHRAQIEDLSTDPKLKCRESFTFGVCSLILGSVEHTKRLKEISWDAYTKGGIHICLPVHCLSARSVRQPYCHTNATSSPRWRKTKLCATMACQYIVGTLHRGDIVLRSRSPRKCHYPLFAYPLFKCAQKKANLSFKSPSPKPHLNWTGSVFLRDEKTWVIAKRRFLINTSRAQIQN